MNDAGPIGTRSTKKASLGIAAIVLALIIVAVVIIAYVWSNPHIVEDIIYLVIVVAVILVIAAVIIWLAVMVLAIPYYAMKGEKFQTGASYNLDDVKSVKEADSTNKESTKKD